MSLAVAARRRDLVIARGLDYFPTLSKGARAMPAKTMTLLTCVGTLSVIFATEPRITPWTFGASCCAIASACLTLGLRAPVDEDIVATFSPIMLGTLRQKMRTLHVVLQTLGVGFAFLGAAMITAARIRDDHFELAAALSEGVGTPHDAMAFLSVVLLTIQVVTTTRGDDAEEAIGHFAHDAVLLTQILTLLSEGVHSLSTTLVAFTTLLLWISNAVQVHGLYGSPVQGAEDLPYPNDVAISFSV